MTIPIQHHSKGYGDMISDDGWVLVFDREKAFSLYQHDGTEFTLREEEQLME